MLGWFALDVKTQACCTCKPHLEHCAFANADELNGLQADLRKVVREGAMIESWQQEFPGPHHDDCRSLCLSFGQAKECHIQVGLQDTHGSGFNNLPFETALEVCVVMVSLP